ncbi:MAG TPA: DUF6438 domain-containing protein [Pyrinomonadaceae bacterium]|nr:DUF6438 domain-containing protein [Pyrinomonadaceae bacterium]
MRFWHFSAVLGTILLMAFALLARTSTQQSTQTPDLGALPDSALSTVTISLERTVCYGNCPAYVLTLKGDGSVEYQGSKFVKVTGSQQGKFKTEVLKSLLTEFARANFLSMGDNYSSTTCKNCGFCTDMPAAITRLTVNGVTHSVDHYYGCRCAPKSLFALEEAIDKAANVVQWTGNVSESGPFGTTCSGE